MTVLFCGSRLHGLCFCAALILQRPADFDCKIILHSRSDQHDISMPIKVINISIYQNDTVLEVFIKLLFIVTDVQDHERPDYCCQKSSWNTDWTETDAEFTGPSLFYANWLNMPVK